MNIDINTKENLLLPIQKIVGVIEKKQAYPILSNVLIQTSNDNLIVVATDLELQITVHSKSIGITENFETTVSAKKLFEILKSLPEKSKLNLSIKENKAVLTNNKSKFSFQTLPVSDFPLNNEINKFEKSINLKQGLLKKLLGLVTYAMAQQDIRYYLNGLLLLIQNDSLKLVATDGHRLAFIQTNIENVNFNQEVILSRKTVIELSKLLTDTEENILIQFAEKQIKFNFNDIELISKTIDGQFPKYERVIPSYTNQITLNRLVLIHALQRSSILSNERYKGVRIVLTENNLRIFSSNTELDEAQEDIEIKYSGNALDIGFNVNYLLDALTSINVENICISFGDSNSSILLTIENEDDFRYVVMPMKI